MRARGVRRVFERSAKRLMASQMGALASCGLDITSGFRHGQAKAIVG